MHKIKSILSLLILLACSSVAHAQDTLMLSLKQADSIFLSKNLSLLAARYKVDAAKALTKQAKLWDNPTLSTEWNFYNGTKDRFFDVGKNGEKIIALEQVVSIAGKRNKRIALAKNNEKLSELEFFDLLRTLKNELHTSYYQIYFNKQTIEKYNAQLAVLGGLIEALQFQNEKGNIPLKDVMRLKAIYYQLNNERTDLISQQLGATQLVATLLQTTLLVSPQPKPQELSRYKIDQLSLSTIQEKATQNRPDLKISERLQDQAQLNLSLEKRTPYPDLHIGGIYDQSGSYINNYTGITLGFDLPILNRNQGNIGVAKAQLEQYKLELENKTLAVRNEVVATYLKLIQVEQEYRKIDSDFDRKFDELNNGVIANFQKRNLSLIEFTDFLEAYNNSVQQINKLKQNRIEMYEELNYVVGEELFN